MSTRCLINIYCLDDIVESKNRNYFKICSLLCFWDGYPEFVCVDIERACRELIYDCDIDIPTQLIYKLLQPTHNGRFKYEFIHSEDFCDVDYYVNVYVANTIFNQPTMSISRQPGTKSKKFEASEMIFTSKYGTKMWHSIRNGYDINE